MHATHSLSPKPPLLKKGTLFTCMLSSFCRWHHGLHWIQFFSTTGFSILIISLLSAHFDFFSTTRVPHAHKQNINNLRTIDIFSHIIISLYILRLILIKNSCCKTKQKKCLVFEKKIYNYNIIKNCFYKT